MNSTKKRSLFEVLNDALVTAASGLPIQEQPAPKRVRQSDDESDLASLLATWGEAMPIENNDQNLEQQQVSILQQPQFVTEQEGRILSLADFINSRRSVSVDTAHDNNNSVTQYRCDRKSLEKTVEFDDIIGTGNVGTVYEAYLHKQYVDKQKQYPLAVKVEKYRTQQHVQRLKHEQDILKLFTSKRNPFVALYFGACDDVPQQQKHYDDDDETETGNDLMEEQSLYLFTERANGTAKEWMHHNSENLDAYTFLNMMLQIFVTAAWYATEFGVIHNDLYLRNVVYIYQNRDNSDGPFIFDICGHRFQVNVNNFMFKIIDFGRALHGIEEYYQYKQQQKRNYVHNIFAKDPSRIVHLTDYNLPPFAIDILSILTDCYRYQYVEESDIQQWLDAVWDHMRQTLESEAGFERFNHPSAICDFVAFVFGPEFLSQHVTSLENASIFVATE